MVIKGVDIGLISGPKGDKGLRCRFAIGMVVGFRNVLARKVNKGRRYRFDIGPEG